jgi:proline dehydrogenase
LAEEQHGFLKKLIFKLVKKHMAGATSASAIKMLQQLNDKKLAGTVTFLNENDITKVKAKYNANSYMQLMKQISRLNIKSDVSIRPSQIGYGIDRKAAEENMSDILECAESNGIYVWIESGMHAGSIDPLDIYKTHRRAEENMSDILECAESNGIYVWIESGMHAGSIDPLDIYKTHRSKMLCFELPINAFYKSNNGIEKALGTGCKVKILPYSTYGADAEISKKRVKRLDKINSHKKELDAYSDIVRTLLNKDMKVTLFSSDEKFLERFAELNKDYRRNLIFELPLGYNNKRMSMLMKKKINLSVYVSYGKDWVPYAINRLAEGHIRDIAKALLDGEEKAMTKPTSKVLN